MTSYNIFIVIVAPEPDHPVVTTIHTAIQDAITTHHDRGTLRAELSEVIARLPAHHLDVLRRTLAGETTRRISDALGVSTRTVERYRAKAFQALGVRTIAEAASLIARSGVSIPHTSD